jgi:hypothetical protein
MSYTPKVNPYMYFSLTFSLSFSLSSNPIISRQNAPKLHLHQNEPMI